MSLITRCSNVATGAGCHSGRRLGVSVTEGAWSMAPAESQLAVQLQQVHSEKCLLLLPCWHLGYGAQMLGGYYAQRAMTADKWPLL